MNTTQQQNLTEYSYTQQDGMNFANTMEQKKTQRDKRYESAYLKLKSKQS